MGSESFRKKINFQLLDYVGSFPKQNVNQTSYTTYDVKELYQTLKIGMTSLHNSYDS